MISVVPEAQWPAGGDRLRLSPRCGPSACRLRESPAKYILWNHGREVSPPAQTA
jgi:hypothetical protein